MTSSLQRVDVGPSAYADDAELLARIRIGDEAAFERLFRCYAESLYACAFGYVGSRDAAEEIVQQLFSTLWERRQIWQVSGTVATYLFRAVRNASLNALRDRRRNLAFRARLEGAAVVASPPPDVEQQIEAAELATAVARVVARLPERCREVFRLNRYHQLTYAEVAQVLDVSVKTVEIHMARALKELRARLRID